MSQYLYMLKQHEKTEYQIEKIKKQLEQLPKGDIHCVKFRTGVKWYYYHNNQSKYLQKKNISLAEQLAYKRYLKLQLKEYEQEKKAIQEYLKNARSTESEAEKLLDITSNYRKLILPYYRPLEECLFEWQHAQYQKNEEHPENLLHPSISGNILRSKSESMIDAALFRGRIPYRYECALQLGEKILYPDFTIIHPETRKIYYWEHFGMMDDSIYAQNTFSKLNLYHSNGIVPSVNLIMTFETKNNPLSNIAIDKIIDQYFM